MDRRKIVPQHDITSMRSTTISSSTDSKKGTSFKFNKE